VFGGEGVPTTMEHPAEHRLWETDAEVERRVAERAGELDIVVDYLPIGVSILDAHGTPLRTNRRADELLATIGQPGDRFGAIKITDADGSEIPLEDRPVARAARGEVIADEIVYHEARTGSRRAFRTSAVPLRDDDGAVTSVLVAFDDVTVQLRRDQADRDFVANAAHQIRTPITAIAASVAALQAGAKNDPADRDRFIHHLEAEVDRLARLGEALLVLTRTQRTSVAPDPTLVPLREVVHALVAEIGPLGVDVTVECADDVAALSNQPLLEQALSNVIENAVKHGQGEPVTISARRERATVVIDVVDHGPGIEPVDFEHAFDRFYRGEDSSGGFGLGLPIAYESIRAAGGTLELESTPGTGTRARITVPGGRLLL
jgi:signal transduction histidine kinase